MAERFCTDHALAGKAGDRLRRCETCGVVASSPTPQFDYEAAYFTNGADGGYDFNAQFALDFDAARFIPELDRLALHGGPGTLLDVGCATGTYLVRAQERGWRVAGVESAAFARQEAARRTNSTVVAFCEELPPGQTFDVVTLHHVLEHVHNPVAFLRDSIMPRVGGRLLIEVPNFNSLAARIFGPRWRDLRPEQHVYHYTADSLAAVIEAAGMRVNEIYSLWQPLWSLRATAELAELMRGLLSGVDQRWTDAPSRDVGDSARRQADYRRPGPARRALGEMSRLATRPIVSALESRGLGERLVAIALRGGPR
jgi:SAM-dependent methyltransferase